MNYKFQDYIEPAKAKSELWRIPVAVFTWIVMYLVGSFVLLIAYANMYQSDDVEGFLNSAVFDTPSKVIAVLLSFVLWTVFLLLVVWLFHRRGLKSLLGGTVGSFLKGFFIALVAFGFFGLVSSFVFPEQEEIVSNVPYEIWIKFLPFALVLLLVQVSAEELLFRGYIMQQLAVRFRSRWVFMGLPSLLFGLGHYNGSIDIASAIMIVCVTFLLGLFLADLTYRTGNLGAAIGIHFANNFGAMFLVASQKELSGLALNKVPSLMDNPDLFAQAAQEQFVVFSVVIIAYFIFMEMRARN